MGAVGVYAHTYTYGTNMGQGSRKRNAETENDCNQFIDCQKLIVDAITNWRSDV